MPTTENRFTRFLRWSERYTKTDMVFLAESGFWLNLNFVFVSLFSFLLSVAFANLLTKTEYGTYQYVLSISSLLAAFTFSGFNTAIIQATARGFEGTLRASMRPQLLWNIVPALAALAWSGYYALLGNPVLALGIACVGLSLPIVNTFNSYSAFLSGKQEFRIQSLYAIAGSAAYYACIFGAIFLVPRALPLVVVNLVVTAAASVFFYVRTIRRFKPGPATDPEALPYARHLSLMNALTMTANQVDNILVFHFLGAANLALYSIASLLPERLGSVFKPALLAAIPRFAQRGLMAVRGNIGRRLFLLFLATLIAAVAYALVAPLFFRLVYPAYGDAIPYSQLYALTFVSFVGSLVNSAFFAHRKVRELYVLNSAVPLFQIALQAISIIFFGLWGLIGAKVVSSAVSSLVGVALMYRSRPEAEA